ncbi:hypothetical protein BCR37DRAFT_43873 [Protomyces lactucae-debilis]|uniref:GST C-terminal domain-containing protein n=1 Tax=Protomyces lactucae-debilis TaxID=2754530 RepID=A0A1Y2FBY1_PROLT|nr:uncharacterized protein BCR37DRAFT_43873 [Protomyces lactucae-debilis]ORY81430.1 hypothetical protein BCR37DRAFT_43873 [Protomyces lactucae-debilis]
MVNIIFYGDESSSPNCQKVLCTLSLLQIPYKYVVTPRPDYAELSIVDRRTPLLSIESDMYCDTAIIVDKLCDIALHKNTAGDDVDATNHRAYGEFFKSIYPSAVELMPFENDAMDSPEPAKEVSTRARSDALANFASYLNIINRNFLDCGKKLFFLGGEKPSMADIYVYSIVAWVLHGHQDCELEVMCNKYAEVYAWCDRVRAFTMQGIREDITWDCAKAFLTKESRIEYARFVKHDKANVLGLQPGTDILVSPADTDKSHSQTGELLSLNDEQTCLRNASGLVMHFPRIGYRVQAFCS